MACFWGQQPFPAFDFGFSISDDAVGGQEFPVAGELLGRDYWAENDPVEKLVDQLAEDGPWRCYF
jgi:hypothetical protein